MEPIQYPKVHVALMEGRRIKFEGVHFFIERGQTAPGQGKITYHIRFYENEVDSAIENVEVSIPESASHESAIDYLIEQAIQYISK